jgi:tetratricopeptide (TPR) repeat protein
MCVLLGALGTALGSPLTSAQAQPAPAAAAGTDLQRQYDEAFQEMMRQPANLDVLFKFALVANKTGDLEGAVSALERMLLIDNNLPRVRLELALLYFRLGSYEVARTYVEGALKAPNLPADVRSRAQELLAQINARSKTSTFSGDFFLGWRYQSNANLGPANSTVSLFGQSANLNQASLGTPDWGAVGTAQIRHRYDFGQQDNSALETQFTFYGNRQFNVTAANVTLIDLTSGPRFQILKGVFEDFTLKPFLDFGYIWVADTPYYGSVAGGLESNVLLGNNGFRNISSALWRRHDNEDTWYLPTNSQYRGDEYTANTAFQYQLSPIIMLTANATATRFEADIAPWQSYQLWGVGGGFAFKFEDPVLKTGLAWTVSLNLNEQWWSYDQPDPTIDPNVMRYQTDTILNSVLAIPLDDRTTFSLSGARFVRNATISNYAFVNNSVMFGVSWRF